MQEDEQQDAPFASPLDGLTRDVPEDLNSGIDRRLGSLPRLGEFSEDHFSSRAAAVRAWLDAWNLYWVPAFVEDSHQHPPQPNRLATWKRDHSGFSWNGMLANELAPTPFILALLRWRTRVVLPAPTVVSRLYYRFLLHGRFRGGCSGQVVSITHSANVGGSADVTTASPFSDPKFPVWRRADCEATHNGVAGESGMYHIGDDGQALVEGSIGVVHAGRQPAVGIRLNADIFMSKAVLNMYHGSGPNDVWVSSVRHPADGWMEYRYEPIYSVNFPFADEPFDLALDIRD